MTIGILGGTGPQGTGIALRLAMANKNVIIGSRNKERAINIANNLNSRIESNNIRGLSNSGIIEESSILFITTPFENAIDTISPLLEKIRLNTKIFVDVTVPMKFEKGKGMVKIPLKEGSSSELIRQFVSPVPVVGALKTISAHALNDISIPLNRDTFIVGPKEHRYTIIDLLKEIDGLNPIDAGPIREAECIERLVPFLININRRYKVKDAGLKLIY